MIALDDDEILLDLYETLFTTFSHPVEYTAFTDGSTALAEMVQRHAGPTHNGLANACHEWSRIFEARISIIRHVKHYGFGRKQ